MSLFNLVKKFAEENPEYEITYEEEMPGKISDIILKVGKFNVTIAVRPRLGFVTTDPGGKSKELADRLRKLSNEARKEGIDVYLMPTESRLAVKAKNFKDAINGVEKILSFLTRHNIKWH